MQKKVVICCSQSKIFMNLLYFIVPSLSFSPLKIGKGVVLGGGGKG